MIVQTPNCSFMLDNVQGFYIETDIDYNPSTEKYDLKGYVIWAAMSRNDVKVCEVTTKEQVYEKLNSITKLWADYRDDIISYEL